MGWRRIGIAMVLACGCGPSVAGSDGSQSGSHGSASGDGTHGEHDTSATNGSIATSIDPTIDTSAGDTGPVVDDTCVQGDPDACPDGCYRGEAWQVIDDACSVSTVAICLPGGPKPGVPLTTYWAIAASGPVFVEYGSDCSVAAQPITWRECMGAADEPADCACFCQNGYCRGDEDRRVLEACEQPVACGTLPIIARQGAADHIAEQCVLEHLRDRVPGLYEIVATSMFGGSYIRLHVVGEQVWRIREFTDDVGGGCPTVSDWTRAELCTLAPADYFAACLEPVEPGEDCVLMLDAWLLDCVEQPPSCG